jgi:hypothetical protein
MVGLRRRALPFLLAFCAAAVMAVPAVACPFCSGQGRTLTGEVEQASLVLYGTLSGSNLDPGTGDGTTDIAIEKVIKPNDILKGSDTAHLTRYIPPPKTEEEKDARYLVFCDIFKGKIDPYRLLIVKKDSGMPRYLQGALAHKDEKVGKRLRFFFDYLDSDDLEISNDAYREFANADYKDYRDMAKGLPADRVARWLEDGKTPAFRIGLYASMLGHCGTVKHAQVLRRLLDDPNRRLGSGVDGLLAGYIMLEPKEGWKYLRNILADARTEFMLRHAALRSVRFLWDYRPDLVSKKEMVEGAALLLGQKDIADLAVDDLRKWHCWDMTDRVLALQGQPVYEVPIVRRSVLRFCLSCPDNPAAARYVAEQRKKNPDAVSQAEELLRLEQTPPPPPASSSPAKK